MKRSIYLLIILLCTPLLYACSGEGQKETDPQDSVKQLTTFRPGQERAVDSLSYALGRGYSASKADMQAMLIEAGSDSAYVAQLVEGMRAGLQNDPEALAYFIGYRAGLDMRTNILTRAEEMVFGNDTTHHLSIGNFLAGFLGEMFGTSDFRVNGQPLTQQNAGDYVNELVARLSDVYMGKQYARERKAAEDFMASKAAEDGMEKLDGGVLRRVIKPGKGPHPTDGNLVTITYEGRLMDGTRFDASSEPIEVPLESFINGVATALKCMPVGAEWEVVVPWQAAYGSQGSDGIPPYAPLVFKLRLISFR